MRIFKIKNSDGLYSTGGTTPRWTKTGKTWVALNHLQAHLTLVRQERVSAMEKMKDPRVSERYQMIFGLHFRDPRIDPYKDCTVEEYEVTLLNTKTLSEGKMA